MNQRPKQLNAFSPYTITKNDFDLSDLRNLKTMYLPLIGSDAFSLYIELAFSEQEALISDLLDDLNFSISIFDIARKKLEAVGLLDTYLQPEQLFLHLKRPLSFREFFKDDLLTSFLYGILDQDKFSKLIKKFSAEKINGSGMKINANFIEAFGNVPLNKKALELRNDFSSDGISQDDRQKRSALEDENFDFKAVAGELKKYGIADDEIGRQHNFIVSVHLIFGFNEEQIVDLAANSITLDTKKIDHDLFYSQIDSMDRQIQSPKQTVENTIDRSAKRPDFNLTDEENSLAEIADNLTPFEFLDQLKKQKDGIVTVPERKVLVYLAGLGLKNPVINILIHQALIGYGSEYLSEPLAQRIADTFLQKKLISARQAIDFIKKRQDKIDQRQQKKSQNNGRIIKKEKKIDYSNSKKIDNSSALKALSEYEKEKKKQ
ncbi:helicase DnaB [Oenococcus alcoholitolerans]|uniref:DnaD domain protein n=1 Tax=Oenococcus alcoholitolerans TaxID=931074 RepID=UPI003F70C4CD